MPILTLAHERYAAVEPDRLALIDHGRRVGCGELERRSRRTAGWLARQGLAPGDVVGLTVRDELRNLVLTYALMRLGCVQLQLASYEPRPMREALAARCELACVITDLDDGGLQEFPRLAPDFEAIFADAAFEAAPRAPSDGPVLILTSSGTTGRPKLVACSQRQVHGYGQPHTPGPSIGFIHYSIESNAGKWITLTNLARGRVHVFEDAERVALAQLCARDGVDRVNLFPARLEAEVNANRERAGAPVLAGVHLFTGGTPVSGALRAAAQAVLSPLLHVQYGATECGLATIAGPETHARWPDSVGRAFEGIRLRIVDDEGRALPPDAPGLVQVRSAWSATAYLDDEVASAKMFRDGWFQPGDIASMTPDGQLIFGGRGDDMMILNSINIFPAEIEAVAEGYPGVLECAAFPLRSAAYGDVPLLAVVAQPGREVDLDALLAWCRERLGTRAPRRVVRVDVLPRNANGKVLRRELAASVRGGR